MTEREYPWDILGVDETDDKKVIKKAYAVLIKQYKPDEYPEEFKEIQDAYQYALNILKWDDSKGINFTDVQQDTNNKENLNIQNLQQVATFDSAIEEKPHMLIEYLAGILSKTQNEIDLMRYWGKFKQYNSILDIQLKRNLSYQIFEMIAQFNLGHQEDNNKPVIHLSIINYLDEIFDWSTDWQDLLAQFPDEYIEVTLQRTEKSINLDGLVTPIISRAFSSYLDYLFSILIVFFIKWVSFKFFLIKYEENTLSWMLISAFFIQRILMESLLPSRRSVGKIIRNLYIIDLNGFYIHFKKSIHRHFLITLNLTPYFLYLFDVDFEELVYWTMIITIVAANLISYFSKGCLLHDVFNKTRVLEPNK
ncbi:MAG: DnaJ domain-containing protein [Proteobacteria bacterium]|nr:DnaJ domain-containing protein [Pseudomonadota bacterium]